ncbi:hypothetical protein [Brevibacillus agri]|uniref:hypothetical protein n=1 Tax=Brevibacillus agri TaxID=51101 RepID=UPI000B14CDCA|nr:hypothetical protein [Brevibacillus agri]
MKGTAYTVDKPGKGRFFWRVLVLDSKGFGQTSFDTDHVEGVRYNGAKEFVLK